MSAINELLHDDAIDLNAHAETWQEAIAQAGALLEKTGAITSAYTESMISSVEEQGPYIVVAPGFAFAHARPSEAVKRTAIAWTRLDSPVEFHHSSNDPVTLVVALAAQDDQAHTAAMREIAQVLGSRRRDLDTVATVAELRGVLEASKRRKSRGVAEGATHVTAQDSVESKGKILTVCGNGLGTSLFLKNTLDQVLDTWGWGPFVSTEATDTISAKGRAKEADFLLTSEEIARTLGDVGVPVYVISNFTSEDEIDAALRELYDV